MKFRNYHGSGGDGTEHMEEEINRWLEGDIKWQASITGVFAFSRRCIVLIVATMMLATPAWAAGKDNAQALGRAIGCGCLSANVDTVIKYLSDIYPDSSETKLQTLASYVRYGRKDILLYDNSASICSSLCSNNKKALNDIDDFINFKESMAEKFRANTDESVCGLALSTQGASPRWENRSAVRMHVEEAQHRGLTPQRCANLLGREVARSEGGTIEERLRTLKNRYDKGLITQEEYERKQQKILEAAPPPDASSEELQLAHHATNASRLDGNWSGYGPLHRGSSKTKCGNARIEMHVLDNAVKGKLRLVSASWLDTVGDYPFSGSIDPNGGLRIKGIGFSMTGKVLADGRSMVGTWNASAVGCKGTFEVSKKW